MGYSLFVFWLVLLHTFSTPGMQEYESASIKDSLTVYVFLADQCQISQFYTLELERIYQTYSNQKVGMVGYFPNELSTPERIDSFGLTYHLDFPLIRDEAKAWVKKFGITITPEVAVWDHRTERLIYRGRIDDSYVRIGKRKLHPQVHDLTDIIEDWLINQSPETMLETRAVGCYIGG